MLVQKLGMAIITALAFVASSVGLGQIDKPPELVALSDEDLKTVTIQLERTRCYGTCPAYTLMIHGDGRVEYNGKSHVKETVAREGRVETEAVRRLVSDLGKMKFWEIAEDYSLAKCKGRTCTDMPTAITELKIRGNTHRVTHYYGCGSAPKSLFDIESAIDKAANSKQWTGDVSKAGPYGTTCFGGN